jgi:uncharacterized spore protein YtfJ
MDLNTPLNQNVETLFSNLENFTQNEGVIGKPVTHGDKTFFPVVSLTLGYGTGNTANKNQAGNTASNQGNITGSMNMAGGALGLGAKLSTEAIIVIDKDNVSMMQMSPVANATQLVDKIPQMLMGMQKQQGQQGQAQGQQNQGQGQQSQGQGQQQNQ